MFVLFVYWFERISAATSQPLSRPWRDQIHGKGLVTAAEFLRFLYPSAGARKVACATLPTNLLYNNLLSARADALHTRAGFPVMSTHNTTMPRSGPLPEVVPCLC